MRVTDVKIFEVKGAKSIRANVTVCLEGCLWLKAKLMESRNGLFLSFPSESYDDKTTGEKKYKDLVVMGKDLKDAIYHEVMNQYKGEDSSPEERGYKKVEKNDSTFPF